jgi:hypothetical protein
MFVSARISENFKFPSKASSETISVGFCVSGKDAIIFESFFLVSLPLYAAFFLRSRQQAANTQLLALSRAFCALQRTS